MWKLPSQTCRLFKFTFYKKKDVSVWRMKAGCHWCKHREAGGCKSRLDYRGNPFQPLPTPSCTHLNPASASAQINQTSSGWSAKHGRAQRSSLLNTQWFCFVGQSWLLYRYIWLAWLASHPTIIPPHLFICPPSFFSPNFLVLSISLIPHQWEWGWVKCYHKT